MIICNQAKHYTHPGGNLHGLQEDTLTVASVISDKGYHAVDQLQVLQQEGIRTVISDPLDNRRVDQLEPAEQRTMQTARRSVKSKSSKALLRRRGMHIERSFAHILDGGGMRRTTLRGWENLNKRFKLAAAFYNLSQLRRQLFGFGTPKQLAAAAERANPAFFAFDRGYCPMGGHGQWGRLNLAGLLAPVTQLPPNHSK